MGELISYYSPISLISVMVWTVWPDTTLFLLLYFSHAPESVDIMSHFGLQLTKRTFGGHIHTRFFDRNSIDQVGSFEKTVSDPSYLFASVIVIDDLILCLTT